MEKYIVLFAFVFTSVNAGIYKWTDADGNVQFGDQPVNHETATELNIRTDSSTGFKYSSDNKSEREYLLKTIEDEKQADAEKRKKKEAKDKKYRKLCNSYRSRLQIHIQSNHSFSMSPDGQRTYLTDEQRALSKKRLSNRVDKYCR